MTLYIQHGYGKANKINDALDAETVQGVIFAPKFEKQENLESYIRQLAGSHTCDLLVDPQFYVAAFAPAKEGHLGEYPYFRSGLTATDFTPRRIQDYARTTIDYQQSLGVTAVVSPTVLFESFADRWFQIALNLANASLEHHASLANPPPLLLSFLIGEGALASTEDVNRFLDAVTQDEWNMQGFYLTVARQETSYNQNCESALLANYLYLVHVLGAINNFRVVLGYTDFLGIPLRAAGASAFASGWWQSQRHFLRKNFLERKGGGQPPRERFSSGPLLNSIFLTELQDIFDVDMLPRVLSGVPLDAVITVAPSPIRSGWNLAVSQQHHWQTLRRLDQTMTGDVRRDVLRVMRRIGDAQGLHRMLESAGVSFDRFTSGAHLAEWARALSDFGRRAGIALA